MPLSAGRQDPRRRVNLIRALGLADLDAELQELVVDTRRAPERVGAFHLPDQIADFAIYSAVQILSAGANRAGSLDGATGPRWPASPTP